MSSAPNSTKTMSITVAPASKLFSNNSFTAAARSKTRWQVANTIHDRRGAQAHEHEQNDSASELGILLHAGYASSRSSCSVAGGSRGGKQLVSMDSEETHPGKLKMFGFLPGQMICGERKPYQAA